MIKGNLTVDKQTIKENLKELAEYSDLREYILRKYEHAHYGKERALLADLLDILDLSAATAQGDVEAAGALYFHLS